MQGGQKTELFLSADNLAKAIVERRVIWYVLNFETLSIEKAPNLHKSAFLAHPVEARSLSQAGVLGVTCSNMGRRVIE